MSCTIKLVVGLQNPGLDYAPTRHNVGAWLVQQFAIAERAEFKLEQKLNGLITSVEQYACKLFLPNTFMNLNGQAVRAVCNFYKIDPQQILIVHDDLDLDPGRIKLKLGGGHGGHNGLHDVMRQLHTD